MGSIHCLALLYWGMAVYMLGTDAVIIESSSHDEDIDSFIVENDFNEMPRLKKMIFDPLDNN